MDLKFKNFNPRFKISIHILNPRIKRKLLFKLFVN